MHETIYKMLNDESFIYLSRYNKSINLFDIIPQNEKSHSSMLAWLLNPNEGHGMGDFFIKNMLYSLLSDENFTLSLNIVESISFENIIIETEVYISKDNILDILILDPLNGYLFIIENKYGAPLTNNQLDRYSSWANNQSKTIKDLKPVLILIDGIETIGDVPQGWAVTNYEWITNSIKSLLNRNILTAGIEKILKDYLISINQEYDIDFQFSEYDKHLANLAERYPEFISWIQSEHRVFFERGILQAIGKTFKQNDEFSLFLQKNKLIILELIEYSRYNWLQNQLQKILYSSISYEINGSKFNAFPNSWTPYLKEHDGYWPIYIQIEEMKEGPHKFTLSVWLRKEHIKQENEHMIEKIATNKGVKFRKRQKSLKYVLNEFTNWDKHLILSVFKNELEYISTAI